MRSRPPGPEHAARDRAVRAAHDRALHWYRLGLRHVLLLLSRPTGTTWEAAEDAVSTVLLSLLQRAAKGALPHLRKGWGAYLYRAAEKELFSARERDGRLTFASQLDCEPHAEDEASDWLDRQPSPWRSVIELVERREQDAWIQSLVRRLPLTTGRVLALRIERWTGPRIETSFGISANATRVHMTVARERLRPMLEKHMRESA